MYVFIIIYSVNVHEIMNNYCYLFDIDVVQVDPWDIEIVDLRVGSVQVSLLCRGWNRSPYSADAVFPDERLSTAFREEFRTFQQINVVNVSRLLNIDLESFTDESGANKDFRNEGRRLLVGPPGQQRAYYQPKGWVRYGLKVTGKYRNDLDQLDDTWITPFQHSNNWYRAFHSTHQAAFRPIVDNGFNPSSGGKLGAGVYVSPFVEYCNGGYQGCITIPMDNGTEKRVSCVFQCAVKSVQRSGYPMATAAQHGYDPAEHAEWLVTNPSHVRPYGILLKEV